eukprot:PhF_6_TR13051/c0_g1_i1/m.20714
MVAIPSVRKNQVPATKRAKQMYSPPIYVYPTAQQIHSDEKTSCTSCLQRISEQLGLDGSSGPIRIAAMGDSITYGNGSHVGRTERKGEGNYPVTLESLLRQDTKKCSIGETKSVKVRNYGRSGATASTIRKGRLSGFVYNTTAAYEKALGFFPHLVIIMLGTNDAKPLVWNQGVYEEHYTNLIRDIIDKTSAKQVWLMLPPKVTSSLGTINGKILTELVVPAAKRVAASLGLQTIDLHDAVGFNVSDMLHDGVHPNRRGHDFIAQTVFH